MFSSLTRQQIYAHVFVLVLSVMPLVAFFSARAVSILPGIAALVFAALWPLLYKERLQFSKPVFLWSVLIVVMCAASSAWAPDPSFSLEKTGKIALVLLPGALLFSLARSLKSEHTSWLARALPVFIALASICIALEIYFGLPFHRLVGGHAPQDDVSDAVVNRSIFCALSLAFIALGAVRASSLSKYIKIKLIAAVFGLGACALIMGESQANQLSLILGLAALFLFPYRWRPAWYILGAGMTILMLSAPWMAHAMFVHFAPSADDTPWLKSGFASSRMEIWDFVSRHILQNPLIGYGVESTRFMTFETNKFFYGSDNVLHPHNFVIELWAEFGLGGVIVACVFFLYLFDRMSRLPVAYAKMALPTLVYTVTVGVMGYGMWQGWWLGQITLMLALFTLAAKPVQN